MSKTQIIAKKNKLTVKQERFAEAMANPNTKSATEAAIKAGYSPNSARYIAYQNSTKLYISEAIENRRSRALAHHKITPEEVVGSAVFQMRSSMDDVLDDDGSFSIEKARETGAVDLLKKHKETFKRFTDKDGNTQEMRIVEVELLTNQDGRKEVANYIGLEKFSPSAALTEEEKARELYRRAIYKLGFSHEIAVDGVAKLYPELDVKRLLANTGE